MQKKQEPTFIEDGAGGGDSGKSANSPWKISSWHWFDDVDQN